MKGFGQRLTEQRKQLNMNRSEFASMLGISDQSQADYENGNAWPDHDYFLAAAHRGVNVNYVITGAIDATEATLHNELKLLSDCWESIGQALYEGKKRLPADKMRLAAESLRQAIKNGEILETQINMFCKESLDMWDQSKS